MSETHDLIVEYCECLENELGRCLDVLGSIHTMTGDIIEEKRRSGPGPFRPLSEVREDLRAYADASYRLAILAKGDESVGVRAVPEGEE